MFSLNGLDALTCEGAFSQQVLQSADGILCPHPKMRSQILQENHLRGLQQRRQLERRRLMSAGEQRWSGRPYLDVLDEFLQQVA